MKKFFEKYKDKIFIWICVCLIAVITFLVVLFQHLDVEKMENKEANISVVEDNNNLSYNGSADIYDDLFSINYTSLNNNIIYALTNDGYSSLDYSLYTRLQLSYFTCNVDFIKENLYAYYPNGNYPTSCYISVPCTISYAFNPLDYSFGYFIPYTYHYYNSDDNMINSSYLSTYFNNWNVNEDAFLDDTISFDYKYSLQSPIGDSQNFIFYFPFSTSGLLNTNSDYLVFYFLSTIIYDDGDLIYLDDFQHYSLYNLVFNSPSSLQDDYNSLLNQYNSYVNTHSYTNTQYNDYVNSHSYTNTQYNDLQSQYNNYVSTHSYTDTQYNDYVNTHSYTNDEYNNSYNTGYNVGYNTGLNSALLNENNNNILLNAIVANGYNNNTLLYTTNQFNSTFDSNYNLTFLDTDINYEYLNETDYLTYIDFIFSNSFTIDTSYYMYVFTSGVGPNVHLSFYLDNTLVLDLNYNNNDLPNPITFGTNDYTFNKVRIYNYYSAENQTYNMAFGGTASPYSLYLGSGNNVSYYSSGYSNGYNDALRDNDNTISSLNNTISEQSNTIDDLNSRIDYLEEAASDSLNGLAFSMISGLMSTPFNILHDMLNFDFFGINLFGLFTSLLTFLIIIWVIKFLLGRK